MTDDPKIPDTEEEFKPLLGGLFERRLKRERPGLVQIAKDSAVMCADCETIFNDVKDQTCPSCASGTTFLLAPILDRAGHAIPAARARVCAQCQAVHDENRCPLCDTAPHVPLVAVLGMAG